LRGIAGRSHKEKPVDTQAIWAMGLMSGTSMDGVDAACLLTDGETVEAFGPAGFTAYNGRELKSLLYGAQAAQG